MQGSHSLVEGARRREFQCVGSASERVLYIPHRLPKSTLRVSRNYFFVKKNANAPVTRNEPAEEMVCKYEES